MADSVTTHRRASRAATPGISVPVAEWPSPRTSERNRPASGRLHRRCSTALLGNRSSERMAQSRLLTLEPVPGCRVPPMEQQTTLQIGDVARRTRLSPDTLRHYERKGLLPRAPRSPSGYRLYGPEAERRVRLVQAALSLGFTLDELVSILRERAQGRPPCRRVRALAEQKLHALEQRIAELTHMRRALVETLNEWDARLARTVPGAAAGLLEAISNRLDAMPPIRLPLRGIRS
jgi:DNA-binding transcriptional MerR regulator